MFRFLWLAMLANNIGTWMQTVGAQWLLVDEPGAATLVALVQTASMLPILVFALPAGALADTFDRRRLLIAVQLSLFVVSAAMTALTAFDLMPPAPLLALTFVLGAGLALTLPAWQALIPELVPREQLASSSALGAISMNLARAVGPAVAGVLIARAGVATVFALNTLSFAVFAVVLVRWRRADAETDGEPERFTAAVRAGGRYVRHSAVVRRIMLRTALFLVPGSALWALLPLVATRRLGLDASGYGVLLAALGVGAVAGALVLPRVRARLSANGLLLAAGLVFGLVLAVVGLVRNPVAVTLALIPAGVAWVTVLSSVNAAMQLFLPGWVRARGLSIYQIVFAAGLGIGSLAWGALAEATDLVVVHLAAATAMLVATATIRWLPLRDVAGINRDQVAYWPEPHLEIDPDPRTGPILVTVTYTVPPDRQEEFVAAMAAVRRSRQRTGAMRWGLFREGEAAHRFVEVYQVPSWDEHLRQHGRRLTGADREIEERARALVEGEPEVAHLLPAQAAVPPPPSAPSEGA